MIEGLMEPARTAYSAAVAIGSMIVAVDILGECSCKGEFPDAFRSVNQNGMWNPVFVRHPAKTVNGITVKTYIGELHLQLRG